MECVKSKKFLFWKYQTVDHDYQMFRISKFMKSSDTFHVEFKCSRCGAEKKEKFVEQDDLILAGITVDQLKKIDDLNFYKLNGGK